jgi:hypothetical protein
MEASKHTDKGLSAQYDWAATMKYYQEELMLLIRCEDLAERLDALYSEVPLFYQEANKLADKLRGLIISHGRFKPLEISEALKELDGYLSQEAVAKRKVCVAIRALVTGVIEDIEELLKFNDENIVYMFDHHDGVIGQLLPFKNKFDIYQDLVTIQKRPEHEHEEEKAFDP